jgi:acetoin utilization deacetylase AcuC-like enzyme
VKIITDEYCAGYSHDGHPERPERITRTLAYLQGQTELPIDWAAPGKVDDAQILRSRRSDGIRIHRQ